MVSPVSGLVYQIMNNKLVERTQSVVLVQHTCYVGLDKHTL